jgi:hypothetical protein
MCEICFEQLTPETCAEDLQGTRWDVCSGICAALAGIQEKDPPNDWIIANLNRPEGR